MCEFAGREPSFRPGLPTQLRKGRTSVRDLTPEFHGEYCRPLGIELVAPGPPRQRYIFFLDGWMLMTLERFPGQPPTHIQRSLKMLASATTATWSLCQVLVTGRRVLLRLSRISTTRLIVIIWSHDNQRIDVMTLFSLRFGRVLCDFVR